MFPDLFGNASCKVDGLDRISFALSDISTWELLGKTSEYVDSSDDEHATNASMSTLLRASGKKQTKGDRKPPATTKQRIRNQGLMMEP